MERKSRVLVLVLLLVTVFFLSRFLIEGAYFRKDLVINTVPVENLYGQIQRLGQSPAWAPELAGGYPLLAIAQLGYWYPPHMILRQFLPGVMTLNISLLLHALLAATGTYFFLRHNNVKEIAAGVGALLLPLGSAFVGKYESLNLILPFMWVPFLIFLLQLFMEEGRLKYFVAWISLNVLCVLVGHPQMALYVLILEAIFVLCVTGLTWQRWPKALATLLGVVLVLGLTSFYWLPILDNLSETDRAEGTLKANARGMFDNQFTPQAFLGVVIPHPFGHHETYHGPTNENELSSYVGPIALVLAVVGLFTSRRKFPTLWWLSSSLIFIGLLLAVGGYSPVFKWMVAHGWVYFNAPARFFLYTYIGLALMMAAGVDFFISVFQKTLAGKLLVGVLIVGAIVPMVWVSWSWHDGVPWKFTKEPALISILRSQTDFTRVVSGQKISDTAPENDFGIKAWNPICSTCVYRQGFISPFTTMNGLAVKMASVTGAQGTVFLRLYTRGGEKLRESSMSAEDVVDSEWNTFRFEPLEHIADQELYFELTSTIKKQGAPRLLIHTNPGEQYDPTGPLYNCTSGDCRPVQEADAAFKVLVDSEAVEYYEALAPYVSAGFGINGMAWSGSLPLQTVKEYNKPIGTWGDTFEPGARTMINRFATSHIISLFPPYRYARDVKGVTLVDSVPLGDQFLRIYRNDQAFPRLQFAQVVKAIPNSLDQINTLLKTDSKNQSMVVADVKEDSMFETSGNNVQITKDERPEVVIQTEQAHGGFLVLRDVLSKGWVATIDNEPVDIHRVDGVFRGVFVPAGEHMVHFQYKPEWVRTALYVEVISLIIFGGLIWYSFVSGRNHRV